MKNLNYFRSLIIAGAAVSLVGCLPSMDDSPYVNPQYESDFIDMIGGAIDKNQTWVTGSVINATVKTSGKAVVSAYTLGKEERTLYARKEVNGSRTFRFAIPQNTDTRIAFEADYGDAEKVWRKMDLNLNLEQNITLDMSRGAATRATMAPSNSVTNPPAILCGESNSSTEGGYAGHHFGYTTFPGWAWDNLAVAVPETEDPKKNGQITNYELISTGPFYLSLLYGCTGTYDKVVLGYYYYKKTGVYNDLVMVDLTDVLKTDYIDGYAKVQYQLIGESSTTWHDANFDYRDGDGLTKNKYTTTRTERKNDNAYNTLLVNQEYDGVNGIQGIRGLTFQINVPVGYRMGFYLKKGSANATQVEQLKTLGVPDKYANCGSGLCFSGSALNITNKPWKSVIKKYDGYTFMGLDDSPSGGDNDCNDVTFGLTAGNGGSLPGVLLPGVLDIDKNAYYNSDGTITAEPKDSYVQNVIAGRDPFDGGVPDAYDLPAWTIGYEDQGTVGDFDFNDVVIKVVPNTANKAKVYICATGGSLSGTLYYDGPGGEVELAQVHEVFGYMKNTGSTLEKPAQLIAEVDWPDGYTMPTDAYRFKVVVARKILAVSQQKGAAPTAICAQGDWCWPLEGINLVDAYSTLSKWAQNINDSEARDWYNHPNSGKVIVFK